MFHSCRFRYRNLFFNLCSSPARIRVCIYQFLVDGVNQWRRRGGSGGWVVGRAWGWGVGYCVVSIVFVYVWREPEKRGERVRSSTALHSRERDLEMGVHHSYAAHALTIFASSFFFFFC